jgi:hypothetical protein
MRDLQPAAVPSSTSFIQETRDWFKIFSIAAAHLPATFVNHDVANGRAARGNGPQFWIQLGHKTSNRLEWRAVLVKVP